MKALTVQTWIAIISIVIGALGLVTSFLQAGNYQSYSICALVAGVLTLVLARLTNAEAIKLGLKK
jgi:hypothetical protein